MLKYGNEQNFAGKSEQEKVGMKREIILSDISKRQTVLKRKTEEINFGIYEADLIGADIAAIIREDMDLNSDLNIFADSKVTNAAEDLDNAWLELSLANKEVKDKFSDEIKNKGKASAAAVLEVISTRLLDNNPDFQLIDVTKYENNDYFLFHYQYKDVLVIFGVPVFTKATVDNFNRLLEGYTVAYRTASQDNLASLIAQNLNYRQMLPAFLKWYEEKHGPDNPEPVAKEPAKKKKSAAN